MTRSRLTCLLILASLPVASVQAQTSEQTILVWSYGFSPHPLHLISGRAVRLLFVNRSHSSHDFTAKRFFTNSTIEAGSAPNGEIDLRPGETRSVTLIPRRGVYDAHCSHFLHKQMGLRDRITVD